MEKVRVGVVGVGNMGAFHARSIAEGKVKNARLSAVYDKNPERQEEVSRMLGGVKTFDSLERMLSSGSIDGVVIATTHYLHPPVAIKAFENGLHVLIEKPAGIFTKQVRELNEAAAKSGKVFSIMFQKRTSPAYAKAKDIVHSGELGAMKRMIWICTEWYRAQSYYDAGAWRGTWKGEGGGVLANQAPHQLDLWQWICGVPEKIYAICKFGRYHDIEVEDDVVILSEYKDGGQAVFISSTGETPGTDRLEISGDRGKLIVEKDKIYFWKLRVSERDYNKKWKGGFFAQPECWKCEIPLESTSASHINILENWIGSIVNGDPLISPGVEGINSLEIANAAYLSAWTNSWVKIPVDENMFREELNKRIEGKEFSAQDSSA